MSSANPSSPWSEQEATLTARLPRGAQARDEVVDGEADALRHLRLEGVGRPPRGLDLGGMLGMSLLHVVQPLVDGHELLRHVPVRHGHDDRRPADREAILVEQAADRVGGDRHRELGVARSLEAPRADDAMLPARATDLDLVDVVEERRCLDQRAVDRDLGLGHQPRGGDGDASHALGVDDDPVRQPGVVEHASSGGSVGDGHGPMLPVAPRPCTARGALQPGIGPDSVGAPVGDDLDVAIEIGADRRRSRVALASVASVSGAGWPYSLSVPAEMMATVGRIASTSPGVVDDVEP